jgi:hypothetical protein
MGRPSLKLQARSPRATDLPYPPHLTHPTRLTHPTHLTYPTYPPFLTSLISNSLGHHLPVMKSRSRAAS